MQTIPPDLPRIQTITMNPSANLFLAAALAAPAFAQAAPGQRIPRPIPPQSFEKIPAVDPAPTPAPFRPERDPALGSSPAARKPFDAERARTPAPPIDRLHYSSAADGTQWVLGASYKASFGPDGATYVPFLGSDAPRNFPLELSLASATVDGTAIPLAPAVAAVRDGDRVVIDRGPIDEVYELGLDSIEQTFVVAERPAAGDLRFTVRLESEMTRGESADGFTFTNEHGAVHYSRAFVRESDGTRVPVQSRLVEGGVEIVVGREYLAGATFPLVVDPVVTTFAVDTIGADHVESDVSYDLTTDRYLIAYERNFSATDGDIEIQERDAAGNALAVLYVDATGQNWRQPQTANLNLANQFLVVCQVTGYPGLPGSNIIGVTVDAQTMAQSFPLVISTSDQSGDKILADVGGDSYDGTAYYCVVWQRNFTATDWDVHARLVTSAATLFGSSTIMIDNSGASKDSWPSVSKSNGTLGGSAAWTIAWHREVSATNIDIRAAVLAWDGTLLNPSAVIANSTVTEYYPRASSPLNDGRVLLAYAMDYGDNDLAYSLLSGTTVVSSGSLTGLDANATLFEDQIEYSVDSDGERFVVAYAESWLGSTFDYDIWVSSFGILGTSLAVTEAHRSVDFSSQQGLRSDVVSERSGGAIGSKRCYISWDSTSSSTAHDIYGALYDIPLGGGYEGTCYGDGSNGNCPCSNNGSFGRGCSNSQNANGASLSAAGNSQTGAGDNLVFTASGVPANVTCTLFQGTLNLAPSFFGDGLRCVGGSQIRIRTKSTDAGGNASWPSGAEADVSVTGLIPPGGAQRYYQVSYRNSAPFCTSATFNISNGMRVLWLP